MKKLLFGFAFFAFIFGSVNTRAQNLDELLNRAQTIIETGKPSGLADVLGKAGSALQSEFGNTDPQIKSLAFKQLDEIKSFVPLLLSGKGDLKSLNGIIGKVKMLIAANRLKNALSGGKSGLLGNSSKITGALNLMQGGGSILGLSDTKGFDKLLGSALKSAGKLDKGGLCKNLRAKKADKKLNSLLSMVLGAM